MCFRFNPYKTQNIAERTTEVIIDAPIIRFIGIIAYMIIIGKRLYAT